MSLSQFHSIRSCAAIAAIAASLGVALPSQVAASDNRAPEVPMEIQVPEGNKVHFQGYAEGFQIYTWDGTKWGPAVPDATLYDEDGALSWGLSRRSA
jgi:hypothetical protein